MGLADYAKVLDLLYELGVERLVFIGGEPFLLEDDRLLNMVRMAYSRGFKYVEAETNGSLLRPDRGCLRAFDYIYVSVDYVGARQEEVRGVKVWGPLGEVFPRFDFIGLTSVYLLDNLPDIVYLAGEAARRERRYSVKTLKPGYGQPGAAEAVLALYYAVRAMYEELGFEVSVVDEPGFYVYASESTGAAASCRCGGGTQVLSVHVDGTISPCPYAVPAVLGNAYSTPARLVREAIAEFEASKRPTGICARCTLGRRHGCVGCMVSDNLHCPVGRGLLEARPRNI